MTTVNASLATLTLTANSASVIAAARFTFPVINGFSGAWIIDPLDQIHILETDGSTVKTSYNDDLIPHGHPVKVDRYGNLPDIHFGSGDCQVILKNQYGVRKYAVNRISGTWYLGAFNSIDSGPAALSITTYAATITGTPLNIDALLLEDGTSFLLLEDGSSKLLLG